MSGFDLLSLIPANFEKVINKLQEKSYFRLQQTSKAVNEAIQSSKNIYVHVARQDEIYFHNEKKNWPGYRDVECFYGVRFAVFFPRGVFFDDDPEILKKNCDYLKKYRITCEKLHLIWPWLPMEQMSTLLDILKPRKVKTKSDLSPDPLSRVDRCEMLLRSKSKTLEAVYVSLEVGYTAVIIPQLLSAFPIVHITRMVDYPREELALLRIILKILRSQPFPNLQNFLLECSPKNWTTEDIIDYDTLRREFSNLEWIWDREHDEKVERDEDGGVALRKLEDSWSETIKTIVGIPHLPSTKITVKTVTYFATTTLSVELGVMKNF